MSQYHSPIPTLDQTIPTTVASAQPSQVQQGEPEKPPVQQPIDDVQDQEQDQAAVTSPKLAGSMARVEYRDQHGNVLPEDLVASLRADGKVKFETRWESQSRLQHAHEIPIVDGQLAPPHPDVEGQNPETRGSPDDSVPPEKPASVVEGNERSSEKFDSPQAKPASEGNEATKK